VALFSAIILSTDEETILVCTKGTGELDMSLVIKQDFPSLILELQENDYITVLCDCVDSFQKCIKWIKIIKKMRPKVPIIVISGGIDKSTGGILYQEGIFDLCEKPLSKDYLKEVLSAILTPSKSDDKINNS
jgi:DNA-binding NtrC family response regulator